MRIEQKIGDSLFRSKRKLQKTRLIPRITKLQMEAINMYIKTN